MGMTLDIRDFEAGMRKLTDKAMPEHIAKGMFRAGAELLRDARVHAPQAPKDVGDLWGSASYEGKASVVERIGDTLEATPGFKPQETGNDVFMTVGFNIIYAARWHELDEETDSRIKWTTWKGASQPGRKYLEKKMVERREKYVGMIAAYLKRLLGGK